MVKTTSPEAAEIPSAVRILVIDDELEMLRNYQRLLGRVGHECLTSSDPAQVGELLSRHQPDLVITDLMMPGGSGMEVLERVHQYDAHLPVIMVTAHGSIDNAVAAMKNQATDYLTKPFAVEELLGKVQEAVSRRLIERSAHAPALEKKHNNPWLRKIIGTSPMIQAALNLACQVARTNANVLIAGESGTGKELFARLIHHFSRRHQEVFVPVDCVSLPQNLLESEMFGHSKGAFTGASVDKMGLFQFAHRGTLFLDEIGDLPLALQAKFLRVLQERRFRPVGGCNEIDVDVRVVAATNSDLEQAVRDKTFRCDLFYRLNVVTLRIPPLRERREDVRLLVQHFLKQFTRTVDLPVKSFTPEALECLSNYSWPGNVRQLQNVVERSVALALGARIGLKDLPDELRPLNADVAPSATAKPLFSEKVQLVEHFERDYLIKLLLENHCNVSQAARAAGCHRRTLYRMVKRHQLDLDRIREQKPDGNADPDEGADAPPFSLSA
jgi:DNA-binding NtrC family response regulator